MIKHKVLNSGAGHIMILFVEKSSFRSVQIDLFILCMYVKYLLYVKTYLVVGIFFTIAV